MRRSTLLFWWLWTHGEQGQFFIHTDQCSLVHLNEQCLHTPWQQKVFAKLLGLQYSIIQEGI
jgi:hypothetical protein